MPEPARVPEPARMPEPLSWQSPADSGWRAAERLAAPTVGGTTSAGLPIRVPLAHLVPGGTEASAPPRQEARSTPLRSPEAVRNQLLTYYQGVRRGRYGASSGNGSASEPEQPAPPGGSSSESR